MSNSVIFGQTPVQVTGVAAYAGLKMLGNAAATTMTTVNVAVPVIAGWADDGSSTLSHTVAASGELVADAAGVYELTATVSYKSASNAADLIDATIVVGSSIMGQAEIDPATTDYGNLTIRCRATMAIGAIATLNLTNKSSSGHTIVVSNASFTMLRLSS